MRKRNRKRENGILRVAGILAVAGTLVFCLFHRDRCLLLTPDQQGDRLMRRGTFAEAAERYQDPMRKGTAYYRAGDFESANRVFRQLSSPEARYNSGNSLLMLGLYTDAIDAYDEALAERPDWPEARANREISYLRAERVKAEGGEMTGGMLSADEIVFTSGKNTPPAGDQTETTDGGDALSDQELQKMWLRRIDTRPADFLKAKFSYQAQEGTVE